MPAPLVQTLALVAVLAAASCSTPAPPCTCAPPVATPACAPTPAPSAAPAPPTDVAPPTRPVASATAAPEAPAPPLPRCDGFVELAVNGAAPGRLTGGCGRGATFDGPSVEILGPDDPRFILDACGEDIVLSVDGSSPRLPGALADQRLQLRLRDIHTERISRQGQVTVTGFGAVGGAVEGTFRFTMSPRLNEKPDVITGKFRVCRAPDRVRRIH